jgi:hypothetical protein
MILIPIIVLFVTNLILPAFVVAKFGWRGLIWGAVYMWISIYFSGVIQRYYYPQEERFGLGVWVVVGPIVTSVYCSICYCARQIALVALIKWRKRGIEGVRYRY